MKLPAIVGLSGPNGAGKDELGKLLAENCGYLFHSVTDILRDELRRQGKEVTRENAAALSKQWRVESGDDGIMFTKAVEAYHAEEQQKEYKGLVLASLRHPGEAETIHRYGGVVVWVDADEHLRYERSVLNQREGRQDSHNQTFEEFQSHHYREMHPPADAPSGTLNMAAVRDAADIHIENNFSTVEEYRDYLIKEFDL